MLVGPGDNILLDAPTYAGTLAAVRKLLCNNTNGSFIYLIVL